jgi:hypothetical protein
MRRPLSIFVTAVFFAGALCSLGARVPGGSAGIGPAGIPSRSYLGFDNNVYPGDAALRTLRETFSFCGYWLNPPPGEASNTWQGKREILVAHGFGFLVLFNGRFDSELQPPADAKTLGARDAAVAVAAAKKEGFAPRTIVFLDQEEGGRMLPEQKAYVYAWVDGVNAAGFRAGIYCSGIPAVEDDGTTVITANNLLEDSAGRKIIFFVYNDACPPSPGCAFPKPSPSPRKSGVPFAAIWQFAQSPRRPGYTLSCPSQYDADGNCYAPLLKKLDGVYIDVDTASSPDPSLGRR